MNQQDRRTYSQLHISQMNRFERKYLRRMYDAVHAQITDAVSLLRERGIEGARRQIERVMLNDQIPELIRELYTDAGLFFARKTYREIQRSIREQTKAIGFNEEWTAEIINFFRLYLLDRASISITETTKQQIFDVLDQGVREGWTIEAIVAQLQNKELIAWRARLIIRTELAKAAFAGRKSAKDKSEYETQKEWISANDHRTRDSHLLVDGEVIDEEARFQVRRKKGGVDMMEGPGDPEGSAENIINCRCSIATVAKRDTRGRLIPKTNIVVIHPGAFNSIRQTITI